MARLHKRTDDQTVVLDKSKPVREAREKAEIERVPSEKSPPDTDQDKAKGNGDDAVEVSSISGR